MDVLVFAARRGVKYYVDKLVKFVSSVVAEMLMGVGLSCSINKFVKPNLSLVGSATTVKYHKHYCIQTIILSSRFSSSVFYLTEIIILK